MDVVLLINLPAIRLDGNAATLLIVVAASNKINLMQLVSKLQRTGLLEGESKAKRAMTHMPDFFIVDLVSLTV